MPALTARDLVARVSGQAEKGGGYVIAPRDIPGVQCFENHQTDARAKEVAVAPTMGATHNAQAANNNPLVVAPAEVFGKVSHAVDKTGAGEKYARIEVAETRNTFSNSEARAQEVVVHPDGVVVAIDMDKNKPTNADKPVRRGGAGFGVSEKGISYTLTARDQHAVAYAIDSLGSNAMKSANPRSGCRETECAPTLTTCDSAPVKYQGGVAIVSPGAVSFEPGVARRDGRPNRFSEEVASTLRAKMGDNIPAVATVGYVVRRLTPRECERLQGLPDDYTLVPYRGRPAEECPDTPRYKALGNGWAVNCARWIAQRIQRKEKEWTQAS